MCNNIATAFISAEFVKTKDAEGQKKLEDWFDYGLTFMQTIKFVTDGQQEILRDANGNKLIGTFSDPPQRGFTTANGGRMGMGDVTPWYGEIQPTMMPGDSPDPKALSEDRMLKDGKLDPFEDVNNNGKIDTFQFSDTPSFNFFDFGGKDGLADLLNRQDGMVSFETVLVGVKDKPSDDINTKVDERLSGTYKVVPLKTFTWGLNFTYKDNKDNKLDANDYTVTAKPLVFDTQVSKAFKGAFDQKGKNKNVEWNVEFVNHVSNPDNPFPKVPEPSTNLGLALAIGLGLFSHKAKTNQKFNSKVES